MSLVDSTSTRWRERDTGKLLVAIAVKRNDEASMVFPVWMHEALHPLDWMPESAFLQMFEVVAA